MLAYVDKVAYWFELLEESRQIHYTFHVLQLRKCIADEIVVSPLEGIRVDDCLNNTERPMTILDQRVETSSNKVVNLVKV